MTTNPSLIAALPEVWVCLGCGSAFVKADGVGKCRRCAK